MNESVFELIYIVCLWSLKFRYRNPLNWCNKTKDKKKYQGKWNFMKWNIHIYLLHFHWSEKSEKYNFFIFI